MKTMGKDENKTITNYFEKDSNCQVFSGPVSNCVFAMPGATVTQLTGREPQELSDKEQDAVDRLKTVFYGSEDEARAFLTGVQGMKPTQITEMVNRLVAERKISELSKGRALWKVLHDCGIYAPSESNWNQQVK